jgi:hypothetical protein
MTAQLDPQALRKVAEAATPGPWHRGAHYIGACGEPHDPDVSVGQAALLADAAHIAAFQPIAVLALLDRLEQAEKTVEQLQAHRDVLIERRDEWLHRADAAEKVLAEIRANAVELLDADDDSYDGSLSAIWVAERIAAYQETTNHEIRSREER